MISNWNLIQDVKRYILEVMTIMNNENNEASEPTKEWFLYIICPCNCGRAIPLRCTSYSGDISELANQIWKKITNAKGLEGTIEFLHESIDVGWCPDFLKEIALAEYVVARI